MNTSTPPATSFRATIILSAILLTAPAFAQATRYVATTGEDTTDCTTEATPCATITYAIDQASDSDTIQIADGEYTEALFIDRSLSFHGESEAGTIIQAHEQPGEADSRVITMDNTGLFVEISDVTIRHGVASGSLPDNYGGGIYNGGNDHDDLGATLALTNVTITGNEAISGGGIWMSTQDSEVASTFSNVTFSGNFAFAGGGLNNSGGFPGSESPPYPILADVLFIGNAGVIGGGMFNTASSPTLTNVMFSGNESSACGGMTSDSGSPTLTNITFTGNTVSNNGGGMCTQNGSPVLTDVTFTENTAENWGGGLLISNTSAAGSNNFTTLSNVTFSQNHADNGGGGIFTRRHGLTGGDNVVAPTLTNVTFTENTTGTWGGGMYASIYVTSTLTNVTFEENIAGYGGGFYNGDVSSSTLTNVLFTGNIAEVGGGGLYNHFSTSTLTNVSFSGNHAVEGGAMYNELGSSATLTNTIAWGNTASGTGNEIFNADSSSVFLSHSLYGNGEGDVVEGGGFEAENSLTEDPLFVDPENGNFQLNDTSPAVNAGHPSTPDSIFATNESGDPIDLAGNPRFFGDAIDMGAYEHQGTIADEATPEELAEGLTLPAPNPIRDIATLTVAVEESQDVTVEVFDVTGRRVQMLYDGALAAGTSETLTLDASGLPAGVYVVRATGEDFAKTQRVTVVR